VYTKDVGIVPKQEVLGLVKKNQLRVYGEPVITTYFFRVLFKNNYVMDRRIRRYGIYTFESHGRKLVFWSSSVDS